MASGQGIEIFAGFSRGEFQTNVPSEQPVHVAVSDVRLQLKAWQRAHPRATIVNQEVALTTNSATGKLSMVLSILYQK